jgi:hypothetical protein
MADQKPATPHARGGSPATPGRPPPPSDTSRAERAEHASPASPAVARPSGFVASGTVIHQDEDGRRITIEHGQRLDLPSDALRKLYKQGAAIRGPAPMPRPAGVEGEPAYVQDEETGLWTDAQGSTHGDAQPDVVANAPGPAPAE